MAVGNLRRHLYAGDGIQGGKVIRNFTFIYTPEWWKAFDSLIGNNKKEIFRRGFGQARGKCQICSVHKPALLYPIFEINHEDQQFVLRRFIMVCKECNSILHVSTYSNDRDAVACYFRAILKQEEKDILKKLDEAYEIYKKTYKYEFNFDKLLYYIQVPDYQHRLSF